ncbi:hypothetical protein EVAR_47731_1 [Eumeta japonica]|uniref:Uncharacterized protein n=1 Tax=Eumeta variegata TaxID=151549 RepID=A0A4C1VX68_EUMVA|nr:hypothetical protein EVAR_47731_1 [Eumeta japonica]
MLRQQSPARRRHRASGTNGAVSMSFASFKVAAVVKRRSDQMIKNPVGRFQLLEPLAVLMTFRQTHDLRRQNEAREKTKSCYMAIFGDRPIRHI